ncbi:unnamed protein product [Prorocentrum cordatum]|uniref:Separase n=1 Tax=Prorocentrum cordatum TaxID=2364126 RepID=A0ABN9VWS2_9DINO|nr:unnamed protein product [Polarella glacialis]
MAEYNDWGTAESPMLESRYHGSGGWGAGASSAGVSQSGEVSSRPAPLRLALDPAGLGGALLLLSACGNMLEEFDLLMEENANMLVAGGAYRSADRALYRTASKQGANLMENFLLGHGLPAERIRRLDFNNGVNITPEEEVREFFRLLPPGQPALVYYCGPVTLEGEFALVWYNQEDEQNVAVIDPAFLVPDPAALGGDVFVVADASCTARCWLAPSLRVQGVAAWAASARRDEGGIPPLTAWLTGSQAHAAGPPEGALFWVPPVRAARTRGGLAPLAPHPSCARPALSGLTRLPGFGELFRGPVPPPDRAGSLLWELQQQLGAGTKQEQLCLGSTEMVARGAALMLASILEAHGEKGPSALLLQVLWLLHVMVVHAPAERWVGSLPRALSAVLAVAGLRGCPEPDVATLGLLRAAVLGLAAACASKCPLCRQRCCREHWEDLLVMSGQAIEGAFGEAATLAGCRVVTQLASLRVPEKDEELWMVDGLRKTLWSQEWCPDTLQALLFTSLNSTKLKLHLLSGIRYGEFRELLSRAGPATKAQILALIRSVVAVEPPSLAAGKLKPELVDTVIMHLCETERMGLAALGAIAVADEGLAERAAEGGAICAAWALSCDGLYSDRAVEQEAFGEGSGPLREQALFCAFTLLRTKPRIGALAASSMSRALREGTAAGAEVQRFGMKLMGRLAQTKEGAALVEPHAEVLLETLASPHCQVAAALAGCCAVGNLLACAPASRVRLAGQRVKLVKAMQRLADAAHARGDDEALAQREEILRWSRVFVETLGGDWRRHAGGPRPAPEAGEPVPEPPRSEADSDEFCVHDSGSASARGRRRTRAAPRAGRPPRRT